MAAIKMTIKKASWVSSHMGAITTALMTVMNNHQLLPSSVSWNGTVAISFEVSRENMTYEQFKSFRTELEAAIVNAAAAIVLLEWVSE